MIPVAVILAGVQLAGTIIAKEKKWKDANTVERFIFGADGKFTGSEFKPGQIHVRVWEQDPSLTQAEIKAWLPLWKKNWVDELHNRNDKYAKNRRAHVDKIYSRVKAEIPFALPKPPRYTTFAQTRKYWGENRADWSIQEELDKELNKWTKTLVDRKYKWLKASRMDPLPGYPTKAQPSSNTEAGLSIIPKVVFGLLAASLLYTYFKKRK